MTLGRCPMRQGRQSAPIDLTPVQIRLLPEAHAPVDPQGPAGSVQEAEAIVPGELLERLWRTAYLERLAHAYWRHLRRISLGLIRVLYAPDSRSIVLVHRRLVLLRFRRPRYDTGLGFGQVTWPIERGLLVAKRGRGHLRISVRRVEPAPGETEGRIRIRIRAEVEELLPAAARSGPVRPPRRPDLRGDPAAHPRPRHPRLPQVPEPTRPPSLDRRRAGRGRDPAVGA